MVYVDFVSDKPDIADTGAAVVDDSRQNLMALRDGVVMNAMLDWNMTVTIGGGSAELPDEIIYKNGAEWVRLDITWGTTGGEEDNPTVIVYAYSANSGGVYDTLGTLTLSYNVNFTVTATVWS